MLHQVELLAVHHGTESTFIHHLLSTVVPQVSTNCGACFEGLATNCTDSPILGDVCGCVLHQRALQGTGEAAQLALSHCSNIMFFPEMQCQPIHLAERSRALRTCVTGLFSLPFFLLGRPWTRRQGSCSGSGSDGCGSSGGGGW